MECDNVLEGNSQTFRMKIPTASHPHCGRIDQGRSDKSRSFGGILRLHFHRLRES
jgi:hypothetical protein